MWLAPGIPEAAKWVLEHAGEMFDGTQPAQTSWRHVHFLFHDPTDAESANDAIFTLDIANITGGALDDTWNDADYAAVETQLGGLIADLKGNITSRIVHYERRYYRRAFSPMPSGGTLPKDHKAFVSSGPPERVFPASIVGTGVGALPPQCAISVTEKTAYPRHWGRMYLPFPAQPTVDAKGMIPASLCTALANAFGSRFGALQSAQFFPVIPVTQVEGQVSKGLLTVHQLQVDNVFDVIRRRRTHDASFRAIAGVALQGEDQPALEE